jgi:hypothetical protein
MKIAAIIIRTMLGLLFVHFIFLSYLTPEPATTGEFKAFQLGLLASMYLLPFS